MAIKATIPSHVQDGKVANIDVLRTRVDNAWDSYVRAANKAQSTLHRDDGVAAGRAWRLFIREFSLLDGERF